MTSIAFAVALVHIGIPLAPSLLVLPTVDTQPWSIHDRPVPLWATKEEVGQQAKWLAKRAVAGDDVREQLWALGRTARVWRHECGVGNLALGRWLMDRGELTEAFMALTFATVSKKTKIRAKTEKLLSRLDKEVLADMRREGGQHDDNITVLWPTPVFVQTFPAPTEALSALAATVTDHATAQPSAGRPELPWQTPRNLTMLWPSVDALAPAMLASAREFFAEMERQSDRHSEDLPRAAELKLWVLDSWLTVAGEGEEIVEHAHDATTAVCLKCNQSAVPVRCLGHPSEVLERGAPEMAAVAAIVVLNTGGGETTPVVFRDPRPCQAGERAKQIWGVGTTEQEDVQQGDVVLFPAFLAHGTPPVPGPGPRVTLSFTIAVHNPEVS
mmetsp:Transcript_142110/g.317964  ORF Transcript_142110/g.317964 Transcript_142110/m.317964 type:complete len:385 (-) Transcript_142110:57-1211(-)